jgi:SAM-dependent methyltransferase
MGIYDRRHAELYDLFYSEKPYAAEAAFVHRLFQELSKGATKRLLDLACGTGSHAIELEKHGYEVVASDVSDDMLACARKKADEACSRVQFETQDMRTLDLRPPSFDGIVCLFDAIGHVLTSAAIKKTFGGVWHHLRPQGLFILEFWHAAAIVSRHDAVRVRRFRTAQGEILRLSETTLDVAQQRASVQHSIYEHHVDGTYGHAVERQVNRFFALQEMIDLLDDCRFDVVKSCSGYSSEETLTSDTWHILLAARRRDA